eukprot:scaffold529_cov308-Pinguiococcus_pyrenoidosus.AAC.89
MEGSTSGRHGGRRRHAQERACLCVGFRADPFPEPPHVSKHIAFWITSHVEAEGHGTNPRVKACHLKRSECPAH